MSRWTTARSKACGHVVSVIHAQFKQPFGSFTCSAVGIAIGFNEQRSRILWLAAFLGATCLPILRALFRVSSHVLGVDRQRQLVLAVSARGRIMTYCVQLLFVFGMILPPRARGCVGAGIDENGKSYRVRFVDRCQGISLRTGCPDSCDFSIYQVSLTRGRFSGASSAGRRGVGLSRLLDHLFTHFSFSC